MIFLLSAILPIPSLPDSYHVVVSRRLLKLLTLFNLVRNSQFVNFYYQLLVKDNWKHLLLQSFLCYQTFLPLFLITVENIQSNFGIHLFSYLFYKMRQLFQVQRPNLSITNHLAIKVYVPRTSHFIVNHSKSNLLVMKSSLITTLSSKN